MSTTEIKFRPMLAGVPGQNIKYPVYASPKLDGVRALIKNGVVASRTLKPIRNKYVQKILGTEEYNGLDGELAVGTPSAPDVYAKTVSAVMSYEGDIPDLKYFVFDNFNIHGPFNIRDEELKEAVIKYPMIIKRIEQEIIYSDEELHDYESAILAQGYEGVMIRDPNGPYKYGRSTSKEGYLLKVKRFADSDAEIIGYEELESNQNEQMVDELGYATRSSHKSKKVGKETLGALIVKDLHTRSRFKVGVGLDAATRQRLWNNRYDIIGKIIKYKYFERGVKDLPRFPTYLGFRDKDDLY